MQCKPAKRNRTVEARRVFLRRALVAEQERAVGLLDVDPTFLKLARRRGRVLEDGGRLSRGRCRDDLRSVSSEDSSFPMPGEWHGMARLCHASLARCSQNLSRRIRCRQGASRSSTKVGPEAGCPAGHRQYDRSRHDTGCCRLRGRPRAIPPGFRADSCRTCGPAFFACAFEACTNEAQQKPSCKLSIPWGSEGGEATARRGCGNLLAF